MFSNTQIMIHERMVTALLGAWRRVRRVKKPCSLSLLSASAGNSCTLSLQDPDDISLLAADSISCGTKFSLLLLLWLTFMPFPPPSSMMSSLSLSLSLSLCVWHKEKQDSVAFYVWLGILLLCHKNLGKLLQNTHSKKYRTEPFCLELLLMTQKNMGKCFTFIDSKFSIVCPNWVFTPKIKNL